jgi:hypothetical protein
MPSGERIPKVTVTVVTQDTEMALHDKPFCKVVIEAHAILEK